MNPISTISSSYTQCIDDVEREFSFVITDYSLLPPLSNSIHNYCPEMTALLDCNVFSFIPLNQLVYSTDFTTNPWVIGRLQDISKKLSSQMEQIDDKIVPTVLYAPQTNEVIADGIKETDYYYISEDCGPYTISQQKVESKSWYHISDEAIVRSVPSHIRTEIVAETI